MNQINTKTIGNRKKIHCFAGFYPNFVRSTSCFVCLPSIPNLPDFFHCSVVVFFIYCLLFVSLSFCYCLMRVSSKFYVLWSSSLCCLSSCMSIIFLLFDACLFCIYFQRWYFCHLCALLIKLVFHIKKKKIRRSKSTNLEGVRSAHRTDLCFSICRLSQVVFIPRAQPHAQSLFLFPILFFIWASVKRCGPRPCSMLISSSG